MGHCSVSSSSWTSAPSLGGVELFSLLNEMVACCSLRLLMLWKRNEASGFGGKGGFACHSCHRDSIMQTNESGIKTGQECTVRKKQSPHTAITFHFLETADQQRKTQRHTHKSLAPNKNWVRSTTKNERDSGRPQFVPFVFPLFPVAW